MKLLRVFSDKTFVFQVILNFIVISLSEFFTSDVALLGLPCCHTFVFEQRVTVFLVNQQYIHARAPCLFDVLAEVRKPFVVCPGVFYPASG